MFIQAEDTPNPYTLKFIPNVEIMPSGTASFTTPCSASASPLAEALFSIDGVEGVFFGKDFISVTRSPNGNDWDAMKPSILTTIAEYLISKRPLMKDKNQNDSSEINESDSDSVKQIKELLNTRIRPAVAEDGGDIIYHGFKDGVVFLEMYGACAGCPGATMTLKNGIENMLKHYMPEVKSVEAV